MLAVSSVASELTSGFELGDDGSLLPADFGGEFTEVGVITLK